MRAEWEREEQKSRSCCGRKNRRKRWEARRSKRWDKGKERRAGTLATVAAVRTRWRSEEQLWPLHPVPPSTTLRRPERVTHTVYTQTHSHPTASFSFPSTSPVSFYLSIFNSFSPLHPNSCMLLNNNIRASAVCLFSLLSPLIQHSVCASVSLSAPKTLHSSTWAGLSQPLNSLLFNKKRFISKWDRIVSCQLQEEHRSRSLKTAMSTLRFRKISL